MSVQLNKIFINIYEIVKLKFTVIFTGTRDYGYPIACTDLEELEQFVFRPPLTDRAVSAVCTDIMADNGKNAPHSMCDSLYLYSFILDTLF